MSTITDQDLQKWGICDALADMDAQRDQEAIAVNGVMLSGQRVYQNAYDGVRDEVRLHKARRKSRDAVRPAPGA